MVDLEQVRKAAERLKSVIYATPLISGGALSEDAFGGRVQLFLKPESLQRTGSFKIRGAFNKIASLPADARGRGVITYSSGNHAQGVAAAAKLLGTSAIVVMPANAVPGKIARTKALGAEVVLCGQTTVDRQQRAEELAREMGLAIVPPYDDPAIIAGQGTIGLEIVESAPNLAAVLVPIGGGGLISGVATAVKALKPEVRVIGVEPAGAADAQASKSAGRIVEIDTVDTIADGLRAVRLGNLTFDIIAASVDEIVTVSDDQTLEAVRLLTLDRKLVVEPSGAVTVAAALFLDLRLEGSVVAVLSGGNIEPALLAKLVQAKASVDLER